MTSFHLSPKGFNAIKKQIIQRIAFMALIIAPVGFAASYFNTSNTAIDVSIWDIAPLFLFIITGVMAFSTFISIRRQRRIWNSYLLSVNYYTIKRTAENTPPISLHRNDITEIMELPNGDIWVKSTKNTDQIYIHHAIEERETLLEFLNDFKPIQQQKASKSHQKSILVTLGAAALMFTFFIIQIPTIKIPLGIVLSALLLWSFYEVQRNKNIDRKTKMSSYLIFLVLFSVIGQMILVLTHT